MHGATHCCNHCNNRLLAVWHTSKLLRTKLISGGVCLNFVRYVIVSCWCAEGKRGREGATRVRCCRSDISTHGGDCPTTGRETGPLHTGRHHLLPILFIRIPCGVPLLDDMIQVRSIGLIRSLSKQLYCADGSSGVIARTLLRVYQ